MIDIANCLDLVLGSPPCSMVSAARFNKKFAGPRPLRFRDCFWTGRADLTSHEKQRLASANQLYINWIAIAEAVVRAGGFFLHEHPADRRQAPYPSLFNTSEFQNFEARTKAKRSYFHQCPFESLTMKPTEISSNFVGLHEYIDGMVCPGVSSSHVHKGKSEGPSEAGFFNTRRLQSYPPLLCRTFAFYACESLKVLAETRKGPTGFFT